MINIRLAVTLEDVLECGLEFFCIFGYYRVYSDEDFFVFWNNDDCVIESIVERSDNEE